MKSIIDSNILNNQVEKMIMYKKEETTILASIKESLNTCDNLYNTSNSDLFSSTKLYILNKFTAVESLHNSYIDIIKKNIINYEDTCKAVEVVLSNIER